ncbi:MAG: iron uptake porin [Prochlorococcaceae cyanobacterium]
MKLFQQLLLAPAALGLLAPMAASAADLNLDAVNKYAGGEEQVTSISQFSDVQPTSWAYQALSNLVERYGCVAGYPNGTFKGAQPLTRWEAAALLNACLDRITEVTDELKKLMTEFQKELAVLRGRVDGLEAKVGELEANQFSTTTKLRGVATFVVGGNSFGGSNTSLVDFNKAAQGAVTFNYDLRLAFDTSFTGKDLLRTELRAGNFQQSGFGAGPTVLNLLYDAWQQPPTADTVAINRLFYQFPIGSGFTATVGAKVRQDDMLALWPTVYSSDPILAFFVHNGTNGTYSVNLGSGAGLWWKKNNFSVSANYVSANGNQGNPNLGGIGTSGSQSTGTVQLAYTQPRWAISTAYTYSQNQGPNMGTWNAVVPLVALGGGGNTSLKTNAVSINGYWQPSTTGWIPSISAGWGYNSYNSDSFDGGPGIGSFSANGLKSQSWFVGLNWKDAFLKGNELGAAVGQAPFITSYGGNNAWKNQFGDTPRDSNFITELWYKFQVTDNISVTPAVFYISNINGQGQQPTSNVAGPGNNLNNFGALVKTTFKF